MTRLALVIALLSSAHALAQPSAVPPPYPAPPQIMPGQWMRLSLDDGRFVVSGLAVVGEW